jgi:hypothetical protein
MLANGERPAPLHRPASPLRREASNGQRPWTTIARDVHPLAVPLGVMLGSILGGITVFVLL